MKLSSVSISVLTWLFAACCSAATTNTYDNLNRLTQVVYDNGATQTYSYDAAGNRLSMAITAPPDVGSSTTTTTTSTTSTTTTTTVSSTTTTTLAGSSATLNFVAGWNLAGNGSSDSLDVAAAFGNTSNVITVWKWIANETKWSFYTPSLIGQALTDYATGKGYDVLTAINDGEGFWVNAKTTFSVPLPSGAAVPSTSFIPAVASPVTAGGTHALPHGWSLIATGDSPAPAQFDAAIATAFSTPPSAGQVYTNLTTLWAWDATQVGWYFWAPSLVNSGGLASYITSKSYLDFATMPTTPTGTLSPATGFWVNMP